MSKYCRECGCYIPDNWTVCPACHKSIRVDTYISNGGGCRGYSSFRSNQSVMLPVSPVFMKCVGLPRIPEYPGEVLYREDLHCTFVSDRVDGTMQWKCLVDDTASFYDKIKGNGELEDTATKIKKLYDRKYALDGYMGSETYRSLLSQMILSGESTRDIAELVDYIKDNSRR